MFDPVNDLTPEQSEQITKNFADPELQWNAPPHVGAQQLVRDLHEDGYTLVALTVRCKEVHDITTLYVEKWFPEIEATIFCGRDGGKAVAIPEIEEEFRGTVVAVVDDCPKQIWDLFASTMVPTLIPILNPHQPYTELDWECDGDTHLQATIWAMGITSSLDCCADTCVGPSQRLGDRIFPRRMDEIKDLIWLEHSVSGATDTVRLDSLCLRDNEDDEECTEADARNEEDELCIGSACTEDQPHDGVDIQDHGGKLSVESSEAPTCEDADGVCHNCKYFRKGREYEPGESGWFWTTRNCDNASSVFHGWRSYCPRNCNHKKVRQ
jgi:hypothetical protein